MHMAVSILCPLGAKNWTQRTGPMGTPWDPIWGPHGDPWDPWDPWEPMGTHGNPWGPMGTHGDPWGTTETCPFFRFYSPWISNGFAMDFPLSFPWFSHGFSNRFSMDFPWIDFSWIFHELQKKTWWLPEPLLA